MLPLVRPFSFALALLIALPLATCVTPAGPNAKYPPRGNGCRVRVFYGPTPGVKAWDDLGVASVDCPLDVGAAQCLGRLRAAACRMGGDLLFDVPKKPLRPTEQGMSYRGQVAHTQQRQDDRQQDEAADGEDQPPLDSGPVEPLGSSAPAVPAAVTPARADDGAAK
jgi:hypothetical protein